MLVAKAQLICNYNGSLATEHTIVKKTASESNFLLFGG